MKEFTVRSLTPVTKAWGLLTICALIATVCAASAKGVSQRQGTVLTTLLLTGWFVICLVGLPLSLLGAMAWAMVRRPGHQA